MRRWSLIRRSYPVTTGLHTATGILTALYKRSTTGGSYLVRSSLTQTALAVQDLGTYTDPDMIRKLWDGMPPIYANINPDPAAGTVAAELGYMMLMPVWMKEKRVHGTQFESGYWIKTLDFPFGGQSISVFISSFSKRLLKKVERRSLSSLRSSSRSTAKTSNTSGLRPGRSGTTATSVSCSTLRTPLELGRLSRSWNRPGNRIRSGANRGRRFRRRS